jgi:hypothetical protein
MYTNTELAERLSEHTREHVWTVRYPGTNWTSLISDFRR